eukprot:jgi/Botrbrau1/6802/Bobra.0153s0005.1
MSTILSIMVDHPRFPGRNNVMSVIAVVLLTCLPAWAQLSATRLGSPPPPPSPVLAERFPPPLACPDCLPFNNLFCIRGYEPQCVVIVAGCPCCFTCVPTRTTSPPPPPRTSPPPPPRTSPPPPPRTSPPPPPRTSPPPPPRISPPPPPRTSPPPPPRTSPPPPPRTSPPPPPRTSPPPPPRTSPPPPPRISPPPPPSCPGPDVCRQVNNLLCKIGFIAQCVTKLPSCPCCFECVPAPSPPPSPPPPSPESRSPPPRSTTPPPPGRRPLGGDPSGVSEGI